MELRPYQEEARLAVESQWEGGVDRTLLVLPTGCHEPTQKIMMADGTTKQAQEIQVGDKLLGPDGTSRTVLVTHSGCAEMYEVVPQKGRPFVVSEDHILPLVVTTQKGKPVYPSQMRGGQIDTVTVKEWLSKSKTWKHIHKLFRCEGIENFPENKDESIPVDPYFLGVLLGDGDLKYGRIGITTADEEIVECVYHQAEAYGATVKIYPAGGRSKTYNLKSGTLGRNGGILHRQLKALGLIGKGCEEKTIPHCYKTASIETRLEILAGLLDTDGTLARNVYDFISKSERLANDVSYIARSVGLASYVRKSLKRSQNGTEGIYWRVSISGNTDVIPCRIIRKRAQARAQKKDVLRTGIKAIRSVGQGKYNGFTVDGDNLYLLDDYTVTHNCGKTIVFAKITEDRVREGDRVLILAHRGELLDQAADKIAQATGLRCAVEKAEQSCLDSWYRITVGSVQTLMRERRLKRFDPDYFQTIIIDEAHHCISDSYQRVLEHFSNAKVLGVTATPDRGDMKNLGSVFESLAFEYTLPAAIREGYLSPIRAQTVPLKLDLSGVGVQSGDFKAGDLGTALDPYLYQIADEMARYCAGRKTVVFLPLVKTSQKFRDILNERGFRAAEVNGESQDRAQVLQDFEAGKYNVLCNSMLLTEGWDCPSVDCIVVLRPTKVRSLYSQMVGRGTRLFPGKTHLLLLDFLWHTERHELCHPAHLICENEEVARKMTENLEQAGAAVDLEEAQQQASTDVLAQREEALAKQLSAMRQRKRKLVDPLQFEMSIQAQDLSGYTPAFGWEAEPPTAGQKSSLEKMGIFPDEIDSAGKADLLLERLSRRRDAGLTTPKQIRFLESKGFQHVGTWPFESARSLIDRIAANGWRVPYSIDPATYKGE